MKLHVLGASVLRLRLRLAAFGRLKLALVLSCLLGACLWLAAVPQGRATLEHAQRKLASAQSAQSSAPPIAAEPARPIARINLERFYAALGEAHYPEQQIKTLLALAGKAGVTLSRAEYKYAHDQHGTMETVAVTLPVGGSYAAIRQFCTAMLLAIPFASLDDISFKRAAIGSDRIDASLRFTFYLAPAGPQSGVAGAP